MRRPRHREVQSFAQVTQLLGDGGRIRIQTTKLPRPCFPPASLCCFRRGDVLSLCRWGSWNPESVNFLLMSSQPETGFEPRSFVFCEPNLEGDAQDRAGLVLILLQKSECNCAVQCDKNLGSRWSCRSLFPDHRPPPFPFLMSPETPAGRRAAANGQLAERAVPLGLGPASGP